MTLQPPMQQQQQESKINFPLSFGSSSSSSSKSDDKTTTTKNDPNNKSNDDNNNNVSEDKIYEYYINQLYPALVSSLPILLKRISDDTVVLVVSTIRNFLYFLSPKWNTISTTDNNDNKHFHYYPELPSFLVEFWQNHGANFTSSLNSNNNNGNNIIMNPSTMFADYMIRKFDTNGDGHISMNELTDSIVLHKNQWSIPSSYYYSSMTANANANAATVTTTIKETWSTWFAREWPLMDWKIGVLLWNTFGGILLVIAILSIVPGRSHSISAKILRWPILGLTYFLYVINYYFFLIYIFGEILFTVVLCSSKCVFSLHSCLPS
jgi:hypothetical protein